MTNPRDTGRWDAINQEYVDQQVQIDFAWGNIPMQPNDDRGEAQLDPSLDSHVIATSGYEGFPAFITGGIYDDTIPNVVMPNLVGLTRTEVATATNSAGFLTGGTNSTTTVGATSQNHNKVKSQSPAPGTALNATDDYNWVVYNYVAANPIAGMSTTNLPAGWTLAPGDIVMYLQGRTVKPTEGETIRITENTNDSLNQGYNVITVANDDAYNTGGTAVKLTAFEKAFQNPNNNSGGVWKDFFA